MVAFSSRSLCYQVGVFLLLSATAVFTVGMAVPWWAQTYSDSDENQQQITRHSGLWLGCSITDGNCHPIDAPGWFKAVQGLQCIALIAMLVACSYAVFTNCCLDYASFSRTVEVSSGVGGILGLVSAAVYVAKTSHILRKSRHIAYSWAFGLDVAACVLVTFIAAVIAVSNSQQAEEDARLIIEEIVSSSCRQRNRSKLQRLNAKTDLEMKTWTVPARGKRLGATSGSCTEVILMQNNVSVESQRPKPTGGDDGVSTFPVTLCACRSRGKPVIPCALLGPHDFKCPAPVYRDHVCSCGSEKKVCCELSPQNSAHCHHQPSWHMDVEGTARLARAACGLQAILPEFCDRISGKPQLACPSTSGSCSCSGQLSAKPRCKVLGQKVSEEVVEDSLEQKVSQESSACPRKLATAPPLETEQ